MSIVEEIKAQIAKDTPQGSENWERIRMCKFTASEFYRLMTNPQSKADKEAGLLSAGAMTYVRECIAEYITGQPMDSGGSEATLWGINHEHDAREWFKEITGKDTLVMQAMKPMGVYLYGEHACGSPDDEIINEDAGLEIKCHFNPAYHVEALLMPSDVYADDTMDSKHYFQDQFNMMAGKKTKWYHVSFDPRVKSDKLKMKIITVHRNDADHIRMNNQLSKAIAAKLQMLKEINLLTT